MTDHPEEVVQLLLAVTIRQRVKESEVFLKQGALLASRVYCCAAAFARAALVYIPGETLSAACSHLVTLRIEFARDQKFFEGARSPEGGSIRNCCCLENFWVKISPRGFAE